MRGELRHQALLPVDMLTIKLGTFPLKGDTLFKKEPQTFPKIKGEKESLMFIIKITVLNEKGLESYRHQCILPV